ncbi:MAG: hypothetical protein ACU837_12315 [Gammaproteobacteria bacterium]
MKNVTNGFAIAALTLFAFNVQALSYECEADGQTVYQSRPCEGVAYTKNLINASRYGGTNMTLTELLAARGAASESIRQADERIARHNRQMQEEDVGKEGSSPVTDDYHLKNAQVQSQYDVRTKQRDLNASTVYNR